MKRHFRKRLPLGLSTHGIRGHLVETAEYQKVTAPLVAEIHSIHDKIVGSPPTAAELRDAVNRFRTSIPDFDEQVRVLADGKAARYLGIRPLKLEIDLSSQCNLRCVMCYFVLERFSKRERVDMRTEDFERLASQVLPFCSRVSLSIGTEPMLNKDFEAILEILGRYEVPWTYMSTNGLLLTDSVIEKMIDVQFKGFAVSVDAGTKDTYERIRHGGKFARLRKNIEKLQAAKLRRGSEFPVVNFNYVLMRSNIRELPTFVRFAHELGVEGLAAMHLTPFEGLDLKDESLIHDKELCNEMLDEARELADRYGIPMAFPPKFTEDVSPSELADVVPVGFQLNVDTERRVSRCTFPWHFVGVDPYGNVLPCGWWYTEKPMGNIHEQPFEEIWNSPAWKKLREEHETGELRETCRTCPAAGMGNVDNQNAFQEIQLGQ